MKNSIIPPAIRCCPEDSGMLRKPVTDHSVFSLSGMMRQQVQTCWVVCVALLCLAQSGWSQPTDFAPGEIMFTGYKSDDADAFSIVVLTNVTANTVIYITDRGWSNTTGYRADVSGEGTISFTFSYAVPCGTEIFFNDVGGANDWVATTAYGASAGTVAIQAGGDGDGIENGANGVNSQGDQLSIYQLPEPTAGSQGSFVCMIQMDNNLTGAVDTDEESELPTGLGADDIVRFNTEYDNAKYDCTPATGTSAALQAAITNDNGAGGLKLDNANNWIENDANTVVLGPCFFCCGNTPPVAAPVISAPYVVQTNSMFTITITGTLAPGASWQLFTAGCGIGSPLQTTTSNSFTVTAPATEGITIYYVRSSEQVDCGGLCATVSVSACNNINNMNLCTNCTANMAVCGDCLLPYPATNPDLDSGCYAMKIAFVLDESGSIGANAVDVKNGVLAFLNALNGQDAQVALIEFSSLATIVNNYTTVNLGYIGSITGYFNGVPYNGQTYSPNGGTNWHDAMIKVDGLNPPPDMVLFFTDGVPTVWTQANGTASDCGNGGGTDPPEIVNPVKIANKVKGEGTHMFMLGVGNGINETNLQYMSGFDKYVVGVNTLGTSDYSIGNFANLAADLEAFIEELCRVDIIVTKTVLGPVCNGKIKFLLRVINTSDNSAATAVSLIDTLQSGYTNPTYLGPNVKFCVGSDCSPPYPPNVFQWGPFNIPPLDTAELVVVFDVLPTGIYTNKAWAGGSNTNYTFGYFPGPITYNLVPTITCPPNVTVQCGQSTMPVNTGNPVANDPDGFPPTVTYSDVTTAGACPVIYTINRTWLASDDCGTSASCVQNISVKDQTGPLMTCPANVTIACNAATTPATTGTATATDACQNPSSLTYADVTVAGSCPQEYTINRTWTATDLCGNASTCLQKIFLDDNIPPLLVCNGVTINCNQSFDPATTGFPSVVNNCGGTNTLNYSDQFVYMGGPPQCSIQRTWTATDNCGNIGSCVQTIVLTDPSGPVLTCPANLTIGCTASTTPGSTGTATATDNCALAPTIAYSDAVVISPTCPQNKTITRTWSATDECGNTTSCAQIITVADNAPPTLSCPANITILCTASTMPSSTGNPTSSDICDATPTITYSDATVAGTCPQKYTIIRTWISTDDCGNSSTCNQSIFLNDNVAPAVTCPANVTILCTGSTLPATTGTVSGTDNCDPAPLTSYTDVTTAASCPQEYTITRTWKVEDHCGNFTTCNQIIFIDDNLGPAITCPANVTILCTASSLPSNTGSPTSADNCDSTPNITYTDAITSGSCPQAYTIARTWRSQDDCGNFNTCIQTIVVIDNVSPTITCPANVTIQCNVSTMPPGTGQPTSTDNCDATPSITFTDVTVASPTCPQQYTITRTWKAQDDCGNFNTCNQTLVIVDTNAPAITCPANVTFQCASQVPAPNTGSVTSSDNCDTSPTITHVSDVTVNQTCINKYTLQRTYRSTDDCGNSATCTQLITVNDNTAPTLTCPADVTVQCASLVPPVSLPGVTATDNCNGTPVITHVSDVTVGQTCINKYTVQRTYRATDECGNSMTCVQLITVNDNTAPSLTCPANVTVQCASQVPPVSIASVTATDNCNGTPVIMHVSDVTVNQTCTNKYTLNRTYRATDECGNSATCMQVITVLDNTLPTVTCPVDVTVQCASLVPPVNTALVTSSDNCSAPTVTHVSDVTVNQLCTNRYTLIRTYRATDVCGNSATCNQTITVFDDTAPGVTCPANVTVQCANLVPAVNTASVMATDNCSSPLVTHVSDVTVDQACPDRYTLHRTYRATDVCGNSTTCVQVITVFDNTAPVLSCPGNLTISCTAITLPSNTGSGTAMDNCGGTVTVTYTDANSVPTGCPQEYTITRTWNATDACGNSSSCIQLITIDDNLAPVITCPANVTLECTASTSPTNTGSATTTDNCDMSPAVTYADITTASPSCPQEYSIARTWQAVDDCGNSSTCLQSIVIHDTTNPEITCPPDMTIECTESTMPSNTGSPTGTDNCDPMPDFDYIDITVSTAGNGFIIHRTWTVIDACGNDNTCLQEIYVTNPLDPQILGDPFDTICSGYNVIFQAVDQGIDPMTYAWSFGSGSSPSTAMGIGPHTITYTYNSINGTVGAFVVLTVSTPGCPPVTDTVANIHVNAIPNANIMATPSGSVCVLQSKTFKPVAAQIPGFSYQWSFGTGAVPATATGYGPHVVEYFSAGSKTVQLIVFSNEAGASCGDTATLGFTVNTCPGQITGRVFLNTTTTDTTGIANVNVKLFADANLDGVEDNGTAIRNVFTTSTGFYSMATITPGYYVIRETQPNPYISLWDNDTSEDYDSLSNFNQNDNLIPVTIEPLELDSRNFFVEIPVSGIVSGYVFEDFNDNMTPQPGEGIAGVTLSVYTDNDANGLPDAGGFVASTTTTNVGFYTIGGLAVGNYALVETQLSNYNSVKDVDPSPDGDLVPNTNMQNDTIPFSIATAENDMDNYFIELSPCSGVVTTTNDNVPGSLRYMIDCSSNGDTITFNPVLANQTLHINSSRIEINKDLHILSSLTPPVMIQSDISGAFKINSGKTVEFKNILFTSGLTGYLGAQFENYGHLILWNVEVFKNALLLPGDYLIFNQSPGMLTVKGTFQVHD